MATDPLENSFRELNWRRKLTAAEEAQLLSWFARHPEARVDWEAEAALTDVLARLPDAPVPTNFTARVTQAVERESARAARHREPFVPSWRIWTRWLPGAAGAALAIGLGVISYQRVCEARRFELARSVATLSEVATLPNPQVLEDFDAIHAMSQKPTADEELLKLLQ